VRGTNGIGMPGTMKRRELPPAWQAFALSATVLFTLADSQQAASVSSDDFLAGTLMLLILIL